MDDSRRLLRHFLAVLAYRTQKALRDAPSDFGDFRAAEGVRTPAELVCHMTTVLEYARSVFSDGFHQPEPLPALSDEVDRFHRTLEHLAGHLDRGTPVGSSMTLEQLLQGPFADALTHAGQLALLRRLAGDPVPPESFVDADIRAERLGPDQPVAQAASPARSS